MRKLFQSIRSYFKVPVGYRIVETIEYNDFKGDQLKREECIGHRSFKRAVSKLNFFQRKNVNLCWLDSANDDHTWEAYYYGTDIKVLFMFDPIKPGDKVTFVKIAEN